MSVDFSAVRLSTGSAAVDLLSELPFCSELLSPQAASTLVSIATASNIANSFFIGSPFSYQIIEVDMLSAEQFGMFCTAVGIFIVSTINITPAKPVVL